MRVSLALDHETAASCLLDRPRGVPAEQAVLACRLTFVVLDATAVTAP